LAYRTSGVEASNSERDSTAMTRLSAGAPALKRTRCDRATPALVRATIPTLRGEAEDSREHAVRRGAGPPSPPLLRRSSTRRFLVLGARTASENTPGDLDLDFRPSRGFHGTLTEPRRAGRRVAVEVAGRGVRRRVEDISPGGPHGPAAFPPEPPAATWSPSRCESAWTPLLAAGRPLRTRSLP
jgi:hypothetical protein